MYQPRRLSPASSSPLYRNVNIPQAHQVKLQLKQITPQSNQQFISICPQPYTKVYNQHPCENNVRQISKERESNPKAYQSMDSKDAQAQSFTQSLMKQSQQQIMLQNYIDTALKNQKQEMLKLFDQQNKQIEFMQQIIVSQTNKQFECELEDKIKNTINKLGQELEGKLKKMYQKEFQTIFLQLETLKTQIFQVNITNSKLISEKLHSSFEVEDYLQKQRQSYQNKKQENQEQKPKENHSYIQNVSKYESDTQQQFQDISNIPIKYIKSLQQSLQNSKISKCSSTNNTKQEDDSPIEVFCEQNLLDSLDNIKVFDPNCKSSESMDQQCRMSTIHENECEDEECFHSLQDIGYSLDQNPLLDHNGKRRIQQQLKSKTLYY